MLNRSTVKCRLRVLDQGHEEPCGQSHWHGRNSSESRFGCVAEICLWELRAYRRNSSAAVQDALAASGL
jgi:hypothetical protein